MIFLFFYYGSNGRLLSYTVGFKYMLMFMYIYLIHKKFSRSASRLLTEVLQSFFYKINFHFSLNSFIYVYAQTNYMFSKILYLIFVNVQLNVTCIFTVSLL